MKKIVILLVLIFGLSLTLGSTTEARYGYDAGGEFAKWVEGNPLDRDYKREMSDPANFTTTGMAAVSAKYIKLWDKELNVIYQQLLLKLNDEEKELLIESQVGWLQYHENEQAFVNKTFANRNEGSFFRVQKLNAYRLRLKDRTLELMEYYINLGGEVEFVYKGNTE